MHQHLPEYYEKNPRDVSRMYRQVFPPGTSGIEPWIRGNVSGLRCEGNAEHTDERKK
jgi:hypothetical protein